MVSASLETSQKYSSSKEILTKTMQLNNKTAYCWRNGSLTVFEVEPFDGNSKNALPSSCHYLLFGDGFPKVCSQVGCLGGRLANQ